jgi:Trk K+ transport system NAD-binding subunit
MQPQAPILITGDDPLAERVCIDLIASGSSDVRVVSPLHAERRAAFERHGVSVIALVPDADDALLEAGVGQAVAILTLSNDDEANLSVALRARMLNPRIRVVLRQFGTKIGRKIEQNLPDCSVISPATHAATTYAGAALDPGCFFALRFPEADNGVFVGFARATAESLGIGGLAVADAEDLLDGRIVAVADQYDPRPGQRIASQQEVVVFSRVVDRTAHRTTAPGPRRAADDPTPIVTRVLHAVGRINPFLRALFLGSLVFYGASLLFFHVVVRSTWNAAAFDVAQMMTNSGFSDASVTHDGTPIVLVTILAMIGGTIFTSIFIGYVSSAITRAQWTMQQGLRRIRGRGHVIVCGAGRTGGAAVDLLLAAGKRVVVVDSHPDPRLLRLARGDQLDLLTGDATHEDVLELCDVPHAAAVVVLTNSDPGNLEIALGARAIRPDVPLVVRMENRTFAQATQRLFGIATFSPAALSAPAFAGLAHVPGTVGRVGYGGTEHTIVLHRAGDNGRPVPENAVPLCGWKNGAMTILRQLRSAAAMDALLYALPFEGPSRSEPKQASEGALQWTSPR